MPRGCCTFPVIKMISQENLPDSPLTTTNIISKLFFWWLNGFFAIGCKRDLEIQDLYKTLPNDRSKKLGDGLSLEWEKEREKCSSSEKCKKDPSLLKAIVREFGWHYMGVGLLVFVEECITRIAQPLFLGCLIRYFNHPENFKELDGYLFAGAVVILSGLFTFTHHRFFFCVQRVGMKIRIACCALVYRKALRLSQSALGKTNVGQLTNLLANDVNRFDQCPIFLHYLWVGPIQTAIVTGILWSYYGPACLAGLFVLVLFIPFQGYCGKLYSRLRSETAGRTDKRIRIMNEIVAGIRVIKMYTWEKPFTALVTESRMDEVKVIRKTSRLRALNYAVFYTSSKLVIFLTLLVYVVTGNVLTAEKVFVTLSLYSNVRLVMTLYFPNGVSQLAEMLVSIKRLQEFLVMEERSPKSVTTSSNASSIGISVTNLSAKWSPTYSENTLTNISLQVHPGELVAVIGHVGSGKGSLLHAILKELPASTGSVNVNGSIAYASQEPWLFQGTVRENIIFGKPFDAAWYEEVVTACALKRDMELFPYGDQTLVGDRGASLSGGQKARITLARAVYSNADIYLSDDILSSVDAEVGRHLFEKCICGILANKARILVTHQLQFLKGEGVKQIILLNGGNVQAQGTYDELLSSGVDFAKLLNYEVEKDEDAKVTDMENVNRRLSSVSNASLNHQEIRRGSFAVAVPDALVDDLEDIEVPNESPPKVVEESTKSGSVKWSTYWKYYVTASSGYFAFFLLILSNAVTQVLFTGGDWWLNFWTKTQHENYTAPVSSDDPLYKLYTNKNIQLYTYTGIIGGLFLASMFRTLLFFSICMNASINLHNWMFQGIIRAPIQFFESNPIGRLLNRMTKDIGIVDEILPSTSFDTLEIFLNVIGILVIVGMVNPILLVPSVVMLVSFYFLRSFYLKTARSVKRLEAIARSPVYSHLSTSLYGLTTIRAYQAEEELCRQFDDHQDMHTSSWFLFISTTRWLGLWVDWLSVVYIAVVAFSFMLFSTTDGAQVGLAVYSAMMLTGMFQFGVHQSAEVENQMVSVERVLEYTKIKPEAPLESTPDKKPPQSWPDKGEIVMKSVELRYGSQNIPVLKDISCIFKSREKIGICGRTGAGKSSLITALYRITEPSTDNGGLIEIDGINVLQIGLHDLRSKISIIPQDPVLFTGTLRKNLDPFGDYEDDDIWGVLKEVHLAEEVKQTAAGIMMEVAEGGGNFSVGQRQLVCLARAILRKNNILILDEATANVDIQTDALIQTTIRTKFAACTVLTIAHRLHTVMDSDKILVLDAGTVKEFDEPYMLLQNSSSSLYSLVQQTGPEAAEKLYQIAKKAHFDRNQ